MSKPRAVYRTTGRYLDGNGEWRMRPRRWAWIVREAHWLAFGLTLLAGGLFWGWLLYAPSSPLVNALKVAAVLVLALAGAVALVRGLLLSEEA